MIFWTICIGFAGLLGLAHVWQADAEEREGKR